MTRALAVVLLALVAGGCGGERQAEDVNAAAPVENVAEVSSDPYAGPKEPFWTGAWAASPALCEGGQWRFERAAVVTEGDMRCKATSETFAAADRAVLAMACTGEGKAVAERWALARRSDGRLAVTRTGPGGFYADVALGKCG